MAEQSASGRVAGAWFGRLRVGRLSENPPGTLLFAYDGQWLTEHGFEVSLSLPIERGEIWQEATGYFEGLLPEGAVRQRVARRFGISADDAFGLLLAVGGDCAGALSIEPEVDGSAPDRSEPSTLDDTVLLALANSGGRDVSGLTDQPQRFSLAGAQEKQPVIFDGMRYWLPSREYPSTHILKFETVPRVCIAEFLAALGKLLRHHLASPVPAINRLRDWQMFNCLIGNWDGHAKNLAIVYPEPHSPPELAPFYDLVAIEFLNRLSPGSWSRDMALAVGGAFTPERITRQAWHQFCDDLHIPRRPALYRLAELAESLPRLAEKLASDFANVHGYDTVLERFVDAVRLRGRQVTQSVLE